MNWWLWLISGSSGLFFVTINTKKINSSLQRLWLIYHDIKTLDLIETKKGCFKWTGYQINHFLGLAFKVMDSKGWDFSIVSG
jgi:hypothetical protein